MWLSGEACSIQFLPITRDGAFCVLQNEEEGALVSAQGPSLHSVTLPFLQLDVQDSKASEEGAVQDHTSLVPESRPGVDLCRRTAGRGHFTREKSSFPHVKPLAFWSCLVRQFIQPANTGCILPCVFIHLDGRAHSAVCPADHHRGHSQEGAFSHKAVARVSEKLMISTYSPCHGCTESAVPSSAETGG